MRETMDSREGWIDSYEPTPEDWAEYAEWCAQDDSRCWEEAE